MNILSRAFIASMFTFFISFHVETFTLASTDTYTKLNNIYHRIVIANHIKNPPRLIIRPSSRVNAGYTGRTIYVLTGLIYTAKNEEELAFVLSHELGHFLRHHHMSSYNNEYQADRIGKNLMSKAGYDGCKGAYFLYRMHWPASKDHPSGEGRYRTLGC